MSIVFYKKIKRDRKIFYLFFIFYSSIFFIVEPSLCILVELSIFSVVLNNPNPFNGSVIALTTSETGNVLIDTLSKLPLLMKTLNAENDALNGQSFNSEVRSLVDSIAGPMKGLLVNNTDEAK